MTSSNQYARRQPGPPPDVLRLEGTLQDRAWLLRQALARHEDQIEQHLLQQIVDSIPPDATWAHGWSPVASQGHITFSMTLPNGQDVQVDRRCDDQSCWSTYYRGRETSHGQADLGTAIRRALTIASEDSSLLGQAPTGQQLEELASCPSPAMRARVASYRRCPPVLLSRLLRDPAAEVAQAAADNPQCPRAARAMYQLAR